MGIQKVLSEGVRLLQVFFWFVFFDERNEDPNTTSQVFFMPDLYRAKLFATVSSRRLFEVFS